MDSCELPHLDEIFGVLRLGGHLCAEDGMHFYKLRDHFDDYHRLFSALGFDLVRHDRDFFYFRSDSDLGKEATEMAVFFFVLVDALGDEGANIGDTIFKEEFRVSELPHFRKQSHRQCMAEVNVTATEDLEKIVKRMERYGFTTRTRGDFFRFRLPAWRFIDLCYDASKKNEEETQ